MKPRISVAVLVGAIAWLTVGLHGQPAKPKGAEWPTYGGDLASTRYSPLDQITRDNFNKHEVAWRFKTDALGPRPEFNFEGTPLMVDGVVYSTAGTRRAVVALDAGTGEMLWMHSENEGNRRSEGRRRPADRHRRRRNGAARDADHFERRHRRRRRAPAGRSAQEP